jgi:hypothetical protein
MVAMWRLLILPGMLVSSPATRSLSRFADFADARASGLSNGHRAAAEPTHPPRPDDPSMIAAD